MCSGEHLGAPLQGQAQGMPGVGPGHHHPPSSIPTLHGTGKTGISLTHYVLSWEFMELETKELSEDKARLGFFFLFNLFF